MSISKSVKSGKLKFRKRDAVQRRMLALNVLSFTIPLFDLWKTASDLLIAGLILFTVINLTAYILWYRLSQIVVILVNFANSIAFAVSAYDSHLNGSKHAYLVMYAISVSYFIITVVLLLKGKKEKKTGESQEPEIQFNNE